MIIEILVFGVMCLVAGYVWGYERASEFWIAVMDKQTDKFTQWLDELDKLDENDE